MLAMTNMTFVSLSIYLNAMAVRWTRSEFDLFAPIQRSIDTHTMLAPHMIHNLTILRMQLAHINRFKYNCNHLSAPMHVWQPIVSTLFSMRIKSNKIKAQSHFKLQLALLGGLLQNFSNGFQTVGWNAAVCWRSCDLDVLYCAHGEIVATLFQCLPLKRFLLSSHTCSIQTENGYQNSNKLFWCHCCSTYIPLSFFSV